MKIFRAFGCRILLWFLASLWLFGRTHGAEPPTTTVAVKSTAPIEEIATTVKLQSPTLTFYLDRVPELRATLFQIPLWQYLATIIYLVLALFAARLLDYLLTVQLRKAAGKRSGELARMLIDLLHGPTKVLAFVLLAHFGFNLFEWPDWLEVWTKTGFKIMLAISLTYMSLKVIDVLSSYWQKRLSQRTDKSFNEQLVPLVSKFAKGFLLVMAVLVSLDNLGLNIRTLLAGVSISGLALGLAAQDTVGNLFGAAAVFVDKPFKIGDRIKLENIDGIVEEIGLRSTRIRNLDGHLITVPNKTMGAATITNITVRPTIKTVLNIGLTYDTTAGKVRDAIAILEDIYKRHPETHDVVIGFNQFADSALNINVTHWWKNQDPKLYTAGMQELNLEIKSRFDEAGIAFAFPSRTVYLRQDNDWRIQPAEKAA